MTFSMTFFLLVVFLKQFLFWLWLWQLKEYHIGRFKAHFETQAFTKIISSLWRKKYPRFTPKMTVIFFSGVSLAVLWVLFLPAVILVVLAPVFSSLLILFFQGPTVIWRKTVIEKAKKKREQFRDLLVIGITGSYGKTSTKEFLAAILSEKFRVLKTKEHQNSEIGISRCILDDLKSDHEVFIVEMGAYNRGGIKLLCHIAKPKVGVLTGINEQHMSTFGSLENIIKAKFELIEALPEDGAAFFNGKNTHCRELYQQAKIRKFLYGEGALVGFENIEGAKAVAQELGMNQEEISKVCEKIENKFGGIKLKKGVGGLNIIDATYSANPDGVIAHLEYLKTLPGKKVIVMPCLIELGKASKEIHLRIGRKINEVCDLAIITTKDRFKEIQAGAKLFEAKPRTDKAKILFMESPKEIFEKIKSFCRSGDVIILESRVPNRLLERLIT